MDKANLVKSTRAYERWLRRRMPLIRVDLARRHEAMAESALAFLRGSFYWWVERWPALCPELLDAPTVLGVGDLHVENFGTWRAADGGLIWGVNDFDEAAVVPYSNDLVRLATSALLASGKNSFGIAPKVICDAILTGYQASLERGGKPIKLSARREWAQSVLSHQDRRNATYWRELYGLPAVGSVDAVALQALKRALPREADNVRIVHRQGGLGSLGRQRFMALATAPGEPVAREAKRLTASAWGWREDGEAVRRVRYAQVLRQAVRIGDPSLRLIGSWVIRRVAPDCRRIELKDLPARSHRRTLLKRMGWETANIHLGTRDRKQRILRDLQHREKDWLLEAAQRMADQTRLDWRNWRNWRIAYGAKH